MELTNRVDVGAKELRCLAPELEDGDTASALRVWEDFNEVRCVVMSVMSVMLSTEDTQQEEGGPYCRSAR
jgi:hypothetical protein